MAATTLTLSPVIKEILIMPDSMGTLFLCATPIGNLEDITLRVLRTLEEVDRIYCEDTRHSIHLLNHYNIKKPLLSFHEHSSQDSLQQLLAYLKQGENLAYISDAGMPGVSDPGYELVQACQRENIPYTVLPGASASLTALVLSGFPSDRFLFEGFLPRSGKERNQRLESLDHCPATAIIYESPHRLKASLGDFAKRWPERKVACCREISKKFEEVKTGSVEELYAYYDAHPPRGECVILLYPEKKERETLSLTQVIDQAQSLIDQGMSMNAAAKELAKSTDFSKRELYQGLLDQ